LPSKQKRPGTRSKTAPEDVLSLSCTWSFHKREIQNTLRVVFSNAALEGSPAPWTLLQRRRSAEYVFPASQCPQKNISWLHILYTKSSRYFDAHRSVYTFIGNHSLRNEKLFYRDIFSLVLRIILIQAQVYSASKPAGAARQRGWYKRQVDFFLG